MFRHFHFLRPELLWALAAFVALALALLVRARARSPWSPFVSPALLPHLLQQKAGRKRFGPAWLLVVLGIAATLAAAGPAWRVQPSAGDPSRSPLVVVFELSKTMALTDVSPSRAERARLVIKDVLHARPDSPTALIVVAGSAHVLMPFTEDVAVLDPYLDALTPDLMPVDGQAFDKAAALVEQLAQKLTDPLAVLLVSDGVPPPGDRAFEALHRKHALGLSVLGVGASGAERTGLERMAEAGGGSFVPLSFGSRDAERLLSVIAQAQALGLARGDARFWQDEGPLVALALLAGVALWFRRGFVLERSLLLSLVLLASGCSPSIEGIWLTPDQQGRLLFDRGRYLEAGERFQDPTWKGLSFYAAEKWDRAAGSFVGRDDARSLFNLGNAYAQGGKLMSALHAYERALDKAPTFRSARKNADRVRKLIHSLQEDTEPEGKRGADPGNDDAAAKLDPDELGVHKFGEPPAAGAAAPASEAGALEEKVWLGRLSTEPAEFLKRKLAVLAAEQASP